MKPIATKLAVCIRSMTPDDSEEVRLLCGMLGYPSTPSDFQSRLVTLQANSYHEAFVAETPTHRVVGWVHVYEVAALLSPPTAEIGGLVVANGYQKRGIGKALIDTADEWAKARGMESLLLATRWDRAGAKLFYDKIGFTVDYDATYLRREIRSRTRAA